MLKNRIGSLRRIRQRWRRAVQQTIDRRIERTAWPQWVLLIGRCGRSELTRPDPTRLAPILPPPDRFWADPFVYARDGEVHIFFEELPRDTGIGRIALLELDADLQPQGPARTVLAEDRHLSYPCLVEYRGDLFMVPESARSRRVDLYRCERFPDRWVRETTLLRDIEAADATLFEHAGRWWLLCAARVGGVRINESLFAFHADTPLADRWIPHPANPLIRDFGRGRPAGRVQRDPTGRLLRPSQDCVPRYGAGIGLNLIESITHEHFAERRIWHTSGVAAGGWRAMHHLDWHAGILAMDAQRLVGSPAVPSAGLLPGGRSRL